MGATSNHYVIDKQYQTDYHYMDRWGLTAGIVGQYDVSSWLGVRAELSWVQKNYRQTRYHQSVINYRYTNNYLLLPVMASFGFGGQQWRGFCHIGAYGGYWLNSHRAGTDVNNYTGRSYLINDDVAFNSERDQRFDAGLLGGIGLEYRLTRHWALQTEIRYYYSVVSSQKDYMRIADPRYHSTLALTVGAAYLF